MAHMNSSSDDLAFTDEVKVYKDEGDEEEQEKSSENLKEDKVGLVHEGEEKTPLEFDIYNKQYASSMFKVPFSTDPRFANYFMSNYPACMNGSSNQSTFMGNKMPLISSSVPNPFNFIPFHMHDPFAQNLSNPRYQLPDPKRIAAAAAAAHFYSLPSASQLSDAWNCDTLSPQSSLVGSHNIENSSSSKSTKSSSNRISFSVSSIADSDKSPSRLLSDPRSISDFSSNNSLMPTGMPLSPSMFAAAAVAAAQAAAFNSSNSNPDVSSLQKAAAAHLRFLSSLHYQKQNSPASNGLNIPNCYSNSGLVSSRASSQGKYHHNYAPSMHQKSTADERKNYAESIAPDRYHQSSDPIRHVSVFPVDNSDIESRKTIYSSRNSIDQRGSITSPDSPKKPHIKKPLNAFMLFMKEMRPKVQEECTLKESAAINQILGKKWHELSREDQTKYYELARKEKELHQQLYPGWSARDNYAAHAKRRKKRKLLNSSILSSRDSFISMNMMSMGHYGSSNSAYGVGDQHPCDMRTNRANMDNGNRNSSIDMMMCGDISRRHNGTSVQSIHGPGPTANGSNPKKCRARFGLEHQNLWCKPCRRKKKCVRFIYNTTDDSLVELVQTSNPDSGKQEARIRHRLDNSYINKSPSVQDNRRTSPSGADKSDDPRSYDVSKGNSFRPFPHLTHSMISAKKPLINCGYYPKIAKDRSPHGNRKRQLSTSSTEHEQAATDESPTSCNGNPKDSKAGQRSVSNHSIEYHLNSKFSSSQSTSSNTTNTNTQLSSENAFGLDKVLSSSSSSGDFGGVAGRKAAAAPKWEAGPGTHPQSVTTISTPPTPAVYSELDYPPLSHAQPSPVTDKENEDGGHGNGSKQDEYEFREHSDSSSESVSSEPLRLSSLTPLVK